MSNTRKWIVLVLATGCFVQFDPVSYVRHASWTSVAHAVIGRPATPVSAAGVARRTTRRCVAGAYHC